MSVQKKEKKKAKIVINHHKIFIIKACTIFDYSRTRTNLYVKNKNSFSQTYQPISVVDGEALSWCYC